MIDATSRLESISNAISKIKKSLTTQSSMPSTRTKAASPLKNITYENANTQATIAELSSKIKLLQATTKPITPYKTIDVVRPESEARELLPKMDNQLNLSSIYQNQSSTFKCDLEQECLTSNRKRVSRFNSDTSFMSSKMLQPSSKIRMMENKLKSIKEEIETHKKRNAQMLSKIKQIDCSIKQSTQVCSDMKDLKNDFNSLACSLKKSENLRAVQNKIITELNHQLAYYK